LILLFPAPVEQTAQDYSIVIENPPGDATEPQEWHDFFRDAFGAHVTACTVAVDNDLLVRSLVERREKLRQIEMMVEPGTSMDTLTLAGIAANLERKRRFWGSIKAILVPGIPELFGRVTVLNAKVQGLAQQDYPATNVFVTFETEKAQREVLTALNFGSLDVKRNNTKMVSNPNHLFRGETVLKVSEPDEPNTVRWQDLNEKTKERLKQQLLTTVATFAAIVLIAFLIRALNDRSVTFSAFGIAIFNAIFPVFAKFLTDLEAHKSEGGKQRSLYAKIAFFRWANTAIVSSNWSLSSCAFSCGCLYSQSLLCSGHYNYHSIHVDAHEWGAHPASLHALLCRDNNHKCYSASRSHGPHQSPHFSTASRNAGCHESEDAGAGI